MCEAEKLEKMSEGGRKERESIERESIERERT